MHDKKMFNAYIGLYCQGGHIEYIYLYPNVNHTFNYISDILYNNYKCYDEVFNLLSIGNILYFHKILGKTLSLSDFYKKEPNQCVSVYRDFGNNFNKFSKCTSRDALSTNRCSNNVNFVFLWDRDNCWKYNIESNNWHYLSSCSTINLQKPEDSKSNTEYEIVLDTNKYYALIRNSNTFCNLTTTSELDKDIINNLKGFTILGNRIECKKINKYDMELVFKSNSHIIKNIYDKEKTVTLNNILMEINSLFRRDIISERIRLNTLLEIDESKLNTNDSYLIDVLLKLK
jgi:hypothetical protein